MVAINTNIASLYAQNNSRIVNNELEKAMERLSSGMRINSAGDDAAGLAIASRMEAQVRGLQAAIKNANDGISLTQVAEGAMDEVSNILHRMRELAIQSANDSNSADERSFLQAEVEQLADEISRIAQTTQFNGVNVLDGTYQDKFFQIGANANQNVAISIGDLGSAALGLGTGSGIFKTPGQQTVNGGEELGRMTFSRDDVYSFELSDRDTGLSYRIAKAQQTVTAVSTANQTFTLANHGFITGDKFTASANAALGSANTLYIIKVDEDTFQAATSLGNALNGTAIDPLNASPPNITGVGLTLNRSDENSKSDFVERINQGLKDSASNSTITGNSNSRSVDATTFNASSADDTLFNFTLAVNGDVQEIDIKSRVLVSASDATAVTYTEVANAMTKEIGIVFDDSLSVSQSAGVFTVTDAQGRSLSIEQGNGSGYFFGTDYQNSGSLDVEANVPNGLFVEWDDEELVIKHSNGGGIDVTNFSSSSLGTSTFDVADTATSALKEPVTFQDTADSTYASIRGVIDSSKIALNFSNTYGYAADGGTSDANLAAEYEFKITDGDGHHYIYFSASDLLDIQRNNNTDAAIKSAIEANLAAQILVGAESGTFNDSRISADEFVIDYSNGVLTIENIEGRDLAVEDFSSEHGKLTVSLLDGLQGTESLSSKYAHASEVRISRGFQTAITASSAMLTWAVDGGTANVTDIKTAFPGGTAGDTGWDQAALLETALQAATADGADTNIRIAYDSTSDEFVITDILGRELEITSFAQAAGVSAGAYLKSSATVAQANKYNPVQTSTDATSGVMTEATKIDLVFSQDDASGVVLGINGQSNSSSAIDFNFATDTFAGSDFKTILNSMMNELNTHYNGSPISYELDQDSRTLTLTHAKGGEIFIDDFVTTSENLVMNLEVVSGEGEGTIISYDEVLTSASAEGTGQDYSTITANSGSSVSGFSNSSDNIAEISVATQDGANSALSSIDNALMFILSERAKLGAIENRLDHTVNNLSNVITNTSAAKGRIEDADFAVESTNLTRAQILAQASTSMLAQANQSKQTVLSLLQ